MAALSRSAQVPEAIALGEELISRAKELPPEHTDTLLEIMVEMIWACFQQGDFERVHELTAEGMALGRERLGSDHPWTIAFMRYHGKWLRVDHHDYQQAEPLMREAYERAQRVLGEEHGVTIAAASELGFLTSDKGLFGEHARLQTKLLSLTQKAFGQNSSVALFEQMRLAWIRYNHGQDEAALALQTDAIQRLLETQGDDGFDTRRFRNMLSVIQIGQGRFDKALSLQQDLLEQARRLSPNAPETHTLTYRLGNLHARLGQWSQAADLYHSFLPDYEPDLDLRKDARVHPAGLILARLAAEGSASRELGALAFERAGEAERWQTRCDIALALLLAPDFAPDRQVLLSLADQVVENCPDARLKMLLSGIAAYRRGDCQQATDTLSPLADDATTPVSGLAGVFAGLACDETGDLERSRAHFHQAQSILERLARPGDLGQSIHYEMGGHATLGVNEEWLPLAELILACREAEQGIQSARTSINVDAAYLATARKSWQPVRTLLYQADSLARQGDLAGAHKSLSEAVRHKQFDWGAAIQSWPDLDKKAAALFLTADDSDSYGGFRIWATTHGLAEWRLSPRSVLSQPETLPADAVQSVLASARLAFETHEGLQDPHPWLGPWLALDLGFAEHCAGNWEAALAPLETAANGFHLACSGSAHALAALVLWKAGQEDHARQELSAAEANLRELLDGNPGGFGRSWEDCALFQILLRDAQATIPTKP